MQLIEVRPLKPFCGSYPCALDEADTIDDAFVEKDGALVKMRVPRKKFVGLISVERMAREDEQTAARNGTLPPNIEAIGNGRFVIEHQAQRTVMVPADVANSLVSRALAEIVKTSRPQKAA